MTRKKLGIGLLETFSEACDICAGRGVIVHHEPHMRPSNNRSNDSTPKESGNNNGGGKGKKNRNQPPKQEVAKVVTAESAVQINSLVAQIAASTIANAPAEEKTLDKVLDALPEPTVPGASKKKSKRVTSGGIVTPQAQTETEKND
jgi:ribonuclease E